ncbi:hypothetical protein V2S66_14535 [Streptomyces sp. V4-01]|uniref:Lipoprotein n=1 Tax=Actinacidiphila polyblastidii TaxID=3110430 RepID=A0ABU7PBJ1_9ACTN|nr:hypothetical protein [Streptomyces sp. V4-01]
MRARTAVTTAALAATAALVLTACGGGGGSGDSDKIASSPTATTPSAAPTTAATPTGGAPLRIDPSLALPADLKVSFDFPAPADRTESVALSASANFMQSMMFAVVKQNASTSGLHTYGSGKAYTYAQQYVQNHIAAKKSLTGTDLFYRPVVKLQSNKSVAEVTFCENQSHLYSKEIRTGKVHTTAPSDEDYTSYDIVLTKAPTQAEWWQAQSVDYKERALECKQ